MTQTTQRDIDKSALWVIQEAIANAYTFKGNEKIYEAMQDIIWNYKRCCHEQN